MALALLWSSHDLLSQPRTITGCVTDIFGPVTGVSVAVLDSDRATVTDTLGQFALEASTGELLIVSGTYQPTKIMVTSRDFYEISLMIKEIESEDIVITALGQQSQRRSLGFLSNRSEPVSSTRRGTPTSSITWLEK